MTPRSARFARPRRTGPRRSLAVLAPLLASALLFAAVARAAEPIPPVPPDAELERSGATIGAIEVEVQDIFDPDDDAENHRLFLLANRLHVNTRRSVVLEQLLFRSGDPYSRRALEESERLLRKNRYFYEVEITPIRVRDGKVDVSVRTRDVWTLNGGASLSRSGGANRSRLFLQDTNFLGYGRYLSIERTSDVDRTSTLVEIDDRSFGRHHGRLQLVYADASDGKTQRFLLSRPFYSLDTHRAAALAATREEAVGNVYALGHVVDRYRRRLDLFTVSTGRSHGLEQGWARRISLGATYRRDRFDAAAGEAPPDRLPGDRTLVYPWLSLERIEDDYEKKRNLDQIRRTEDLHLGGEARLRLGLAAEAFGSDRDAAVLEGSASTGFRFASERTLLASSTLVGRLERGGARGVLVDGSLRFYQRNFGDHLFFATLDGAFGHRLDVDQQILLGGDNGLRGYPLRYQDGDARALLTLEQRFFTRLYPFRLVHIGAAAFVDVGRTWAGDSARARNLGVLTDVGIGLRLSSSRSGLGNVVHLDLAVPLGGERSIRNVQFLVSTKASL